MARKYDYDAWSHSSCNNQWWETQEKFDDLERKETQEKFDDLERKCRWLHDQLDEKCDEMKRLDGEVTHLMQRVSEAEDVNAALKRELADLRDGVAGASAAGVSEIPEAEAPGRAGLKREIPAEAPVVGELPQAKRLASTSDGEKEWKHFEAKAGDTATSRGPCQNCHGGIVVDPEQEEELKEMWNDWPLKMAPWCSHLGSTLFSERGTRTWPDIEKKLTKRLGRFLVWGSTNKNSRMYICRCSECKAIVTAQYGAWDEEEHQGARDTLALFVLGRKAEDSKRS